MQISILCFFKGVRSKFIAFLSIILVISVTPDFLLAQLPNAYEYFPLAVGNEWTYQVLHFDQYSHRQVIGDSLLGDTLRVYRVLENETIYSYHYNADSTVVYQNDGFPEAMDAGFPFLDTRHGLNSRWTVTSAGVTRAFAIKDTGRTELFGALRPTANLWEVSAHSDPLVYLEALGSYAQDIGLSSFGEEVLVHAKIGNIEYGDRPTGLTAPRSGKVPLHFQLHIYPNPVKQSATLVVQTPWEKNIRISIFDILGRTVQTFSTNAASRTIELVWNGKDRNGKHVSNGVYFLVADFDGFSKAIKFIYLR